MIDLKPFCGTDKQRPYLQQPFSRGEYTYATNGHILVRVERRPDAPERSDAPNAERVIPALPSEWRKLTAKLPKESVEDCEECEGEGGGYHSCPNCDCECPTCDGTGKVSGDRWRSVRINGVSFDLHYARMLLALPGIEAGTPTPERGPLVFRFDGGIGLLMPLSSERFDAIDMDLAA